MNLPAFAQEAIEKRIASGRYTTPDEVLQCAFEARLEGEEYEEEVRAGVLEGVAELDRGEGVDAEEVFRFLRERSNPANKQQSA